MSKKILCTGNPEFGVASEIANIWPETEFISRTGWGWDLTQNNYKRRLAKKCLDYDVFINCSALWQYHQTILLDVVYKTAREVNHPLHIISLGSTTDRATKGSDWQYQQEKKALKSTSNALGLKSIWAGGPKVSYISFGTLSNNQHKHPDRKCLDINKAAEYIAWVIEQPEHININEISIDPMQF